MGKNLKGVSNIVVLIGAVLAFNQTFAAEQKSSPHMPWFETEVIEDRGGQPIDPYLPKNNNTLEHMKKLYDERRSKKLVHSHFPVVTASMSVGRVTEDEARDVKYQMATRPMFIIGYDPVSIKWLYSNKELLKEKKAIGLVVNIQTKEQMEELQSIVGDGVLMQPTPGDRLAEHLKIRHYPFYMDNQGVMR